MINGQRKWIALFVAFTFMWLLQVSVTPLTAAGNAERVSAANGEQGPDFVEQQGTAASAGGKKSILPYVLIGIGVAAVAAVLVLVVFKTSYDITGSWDFVFTMGSNSVPLTITFSGTKASGTYETPANPALTGGYTVDKKNATMTISGEPAIQFYGSFTDKDTMSGTFIEGTQNWTWTATRSTAATTAQPRPAAGGKILGQ